MRNKFWEKFEMFNVTRNASVFNYNFNSVWDICDGFRFIVFGILVNSINFLGIILNIMSIIALSFKNFKNSTTYMLVGIEVADTLYLIMYFLSVSFPALIKYSERLSTQKDTILDNFNFVTMRRKVFPSLIAGSLMMSSWHVTLVTMERYIAVCHPHHASKFNKQKALIAQVIIFIFAYLLNIVQSFENEVKYNEIKGIWIVLPTDMKTNQIYSIYSIIQYFIIQILIPILSISIMTAFIIKVVYSLIRKVFIIYLFIYLKNSFNFCLNNFFFSFSLKEAKEDVSK